MLGSRFSQFGGCEIDLYSFILCFRLFWGEDDLVKMLLICATIGYLYASVMALLQTMEADEKPQKQKGRLNSTPAQEQAVSAALLDKPPPLKGVRTDVRYYHFLPVVRYYIIVKERESSDVEAIFRVNSLSSFSLGFAQIAGLLFSMLRSGGEITTLHKISIFSQCVNWFVTFVYFATPICPLMKAVLDYDAKLQNVKVYIRNKMLRWEELTQRSCRGEPHTEELFERFEEAFDRELFTMVSLAKDVENIPNREQLGFEMCSMQWKIDVYLKLYEQFMDRFLNVTMFGS